MGRRGIEIVKFNVKELINLLNKALADEWFAYYQYWVSAEIVEGHMRETAILELTQHANDELKHAKMLSERIIQLGGVPLNDPREWSQFANCDYLVPSNPNIKAIIQKGVEGERCAIDVYNQLLMDLKDKDPITYDMILSILKDELEHEEDFENLLRDLEIK